MICLIFEKVETEVGQTGLNGPHAPRLAQTKDRTMLQEKPDPEPARIQHQNTEATTVEAILQM